LIERNAFTPLRARRAADHLVETMRDGFDDAEVLDWERYVGSVVLPDPDDRHVVACAVAGRADAIITSNLRHFPAECMPQTVEVVSPQVFAMRNVTLDPIRARRAIEGIVARSGTSGRPRRTFTGVLAELASRYAMTDAVAYLRET
jgi:hypothetical protein